MESLLIYALLTSAAFYLGSRAVITHWLWSRYPPWLARLMDCAACSGFWFGLLASFVLNLSLPVYLPYVMSHMVIGLCSVVWTPIVAGLMQLGLSQLGTTIEENDGDGAGTAE